MKKLGKLKMPESKKMDMSELESDAGEMEFAGDEAPSDEKSEEFAAEEDMEFPEEKPAGAGDLEALSDEDLLAEVKKRGLMAQLEKGSEPASGEEEDEQYI